MKDSIILNKMRLKSKKLCHWKQDWSNQQYRVRCYSSSFSILFKIFSSFLKCFQFERLCFWVRVSPNILNVFFVFQFNIYLFLLSQWIHNFFSRHHCRCRTFTNFRWKVDKEGNNVKLTQFFGASFFFVIVVVRFFLRILFA